MARAIGARVVLVGGGDEENLSIRYLAAVLEDAGHSARIVDCSRREDIPKVLKAISEYEPHLTGISIAFQCISGTYFDLIREIRESGYGGHIIVGGHFPTFDYQRIFETQSGVDSVGRFEGESTIVGLADHLTKGNPLSSITNLVYRSQDGLHENECLQRFRDLDAIPFPKRDSKPHIRLGERFATLVSSRGCWHSSCLYCCIGAFHSKKPSKFAARSPENVSRELAQLYHKQGARLFQFHDDNFMPSTKENTLTWLGDLKRGFESEKVNTDEMAFLIKARPDTVDDEVASALKDFGVVGVFLGVENASETGLKSLMRGVELKDVKTAVSALEKQKIISTYNLLIFHPKATITEINENIQFIGEHTRLPFDFGRAEIVAGSPLERMLVNEGKLLGSWPNWNYEIRDALVERMFKINCLTFRHDSSYYSRLAESTIALAYHAYALGRLHPGALTDSLVLETDRLMGEINASTLKMMLRMYDLTLNSIKEEDTELLRKEIMQGCLAHLKSISKLTHRMRILQNSDRIFRMFGVRDTMQKHGLFRSLLRA